MRSKLALLFPLTLAACHSDSDSGPEPAPDTVALNLGVAVQGQFGSGTVRLFLASEEAQGEDLTGDGDLEDEVWHLLEPFTNTPILPILPPLASTGLASPPRSGPVPGPASDSNAELALFRVSEEKTGRDLDQDGITDEISTWVFNRRTARLEGLPFEHASHALEGTLAAFYVSEPGLDARLHVFDARDGSLTTLPVEPSALFAVGEGLVAFARAEEGAFDLNADGDSSDGFVVHLYDANSGRIVNTSWATDTSVGVRAGFAGINVAEELNGGIDLDGDGDATDVFFVAVDGRTGLTRRPGFGSAEAADGQEQVSDRFLLIVQEAGVDQNGDGDGFDQLALVYDPRADVVLDTGINVGTPSIHVAGRWVGVTEFDLGALTNVPQVFDTLTGRHIDLGFQGLFLRALDGQILGIDLSPEHLFELFAWDPRAGTLHFPGVVIAQGDVVRVAGDAALLQVSEDDGDRNGDGDIADIVLARYDARTRSVINLRLATVDSVRGALGRATVLVDEADQGGVDLNEDGDSSDAVLHEVLLDPPRL